MDFFSSATQSWFESAFAGPTEVQRRGWPIIAAGGNALLIAPTGSGKTLAAFLYCIDRLTQRPPLEPGVRVVYVSPLKALVYDIERNLRTPLAGVARFVGGDRRLPRVSVRTGDTSSKERRQQLKDPGEILVTTPESLYLLLGSSARENLRTVETIVIDEVHALAPTKRGAHLSLSLERLSALATTDPQRIGLSATASPLDEVARYLGGDRAVSLVDTSARPRLDLQVVVPVEDMTRPEPGPDAVDNRIEDDDGGESLLFPRAGGGAEKGLWPSIYPELISLVRAHRSTIIFVNSRGLCERLTQRLNDVAGEPLVRSHHGSLAHDERERIEEELKRGDLAAIVATSSLELGIDMGSVDLVVLVESPGSAARGLQRVGRAGHGVGETSVGRVFPKHRGDLLEAAVVCERMMAGAIEALRVPENPLDVLAQQVVAMVATEPLEVADVARVVRRSANYRDLPKSALDAVLDMLSGRYPSHQFADLRPSLVWDRENDDLTPRRGARLLALVNGGTIPDRGTFGVHLGEDGPRVGELDEEMVHETVPGQVFTLGASSWRVERITRDRVLVSPAPGEVGKLPFWRGDGPGRPIELGRAIGAFLRELLTLGEDAATAWLKREYRLDDLAAGNLLAHVREQRETAGSVPTDRVIVIERFRDELGDWRICILSLFGARVHAPWALALESMLSTRTGFEIQTLWSDDGIVLRFSDGDELPEADQLIPDPDEVEELILSHLGGSALFASQFRENAARSLLLPRRRPGQRMPLWSQRLKAQQLLAVARQFPSFPVVMETYRSCLRDVFDVPALIDLLRDVRSRAIRVDIAETPTPSPFARSLVFAYVAAYLYEGDAPLAERKAQALSLDRKLLRELLGEEQLRDLLDAEVIDEVERELQRLADDLRARHKDGVCDLLRRLGDLTDEELRQRCAEDPTPWLQELTRERRIGRVRIRGEERVIAIEDAGLYRDALGCAPPAGTPAAFLERVDDPLEALASRFARTHGPFRSTAIAARFSLTTGQIEPALKQLVDREGLLRGEFRPDGAGAEWCDPEVLRRIKRLTLARLRNEVAPVEGVALARFLPAWHGVGERAGGIARLKEIIVQLEGLPLSYGELERHGVVSREVAALEDLPGGFSAVYPVLKEMEQVGRARRGHFVDGLMGAQFAFPGAVDRLRGLRRETIDDPPVLLLATTDPANPYGVQLPWPTRDGEERAPKPRRVAGAIVVLVDGHPVLYVGPGGKQLLTFPSADEPTRLQLAAAALKTVAGRRRRRALRIDRIDGEDAATSRFAAPLTDAGFVAGYRGLELEV